MPAAIAVPAGIQSLGDYGPSNVPRKIASVSVSLTAPAASEWIVIVAVAAVESAITGTFTNHVSELVGTSVATSESGPCVCVVVQLPTVQNHSVFGPSSAAVPSPLTRTPLIVSVALRFCNVTTYCSVLP